MNLADQIINGGPYVAWDNVSVRFDADEFNALRDELIEGRKLHTAAASLDECARRLDPSERWALLRAEGCGWCGSDHLAELVRRADEHTEDCR